MNGILVVILNSLALLGALVSGIVAVQAKKQLILPSPPIGQACNSSIVMRP